MAYQLLHQELQAINGGSTDGVNWFDIALATSDTIHLQLHHHHRPIIDD